MNQRRPYHYRPWLIGLIFIGLFVVPLLLAWVLVKHRVMWGTVNHGLLLPTPVYISDVGVKQRSGAPVDWRRSWWMAIKAGTACDRSCQKNVYIIRQVQTALNQNRNRVKRMLLFSPQAPLASKPLQDLQRQYPKMLMATVPTASWRAQILSKLPKKLAFQSAKHYLIDPRGQIVLVYPGPIDGQALLHDIKRLLRNSSRA